MATFYLIRHANNDMVGKAITGWMPGVHLNADGRTQAERLARKLQGRPIRRIYTSPLERAVETAEAIAKQVGAPLEVREAFTEVPAGEWTGKTYQQREGDPRWRRYNENRGGTRIPGGELMLETQTRVVTELLCLREQHLQDTIAVVSHGDPIRAALMYFLGMPMDLFHRIEISTAAFSILRLEEWGAQVLGVNERAE